MTTYFELLDFNIFQVDNFRLEPLFRPLLRKLLRYLCGSARLGAIEDAHPSIVDFGSRSLGF